MYSKSNDFVIYNLLLSIVFRKDGLPISVIRNILAAGMVHQFYCSFHNPRLHKCSSNVDHYWPLSWEAPVFGD